MDIIKDDMFRKQIKKGLSGGYLFYGEEDYMKAHALRSAREAICADPTFALFNDVRLDALDYTPDALVNALMPLPMMADSKIITVTGLPIGAMRANEIDELCDALTSLKEYDYNVLIISVPSGQIEEGTPKRPSQIITRLSEYLTPVSFESISGARLVSWVGKHFEHYGAHASPEVCSFLIEYCGRSMFTLASETEKLSYYVLHNGRDTVTREDVENISISAITEETYALTNAILDLDRAKALDALSVMKFRRIDPIVVMGEVSSTVCDLLSVKLLSEENVPLPEMARILCDRKKRPMNEYKLRKYIAGVSAKSTQRLKRTLALCSEADLALKLSAQGYEEIEKLICGL